MRRKSRSTMFTRPSVCSHALQPGREGAHGQATAEQGRDSEGHEGHLREAALRSSMREDQNGGWKERPIDVVEPGGPLEGRSPAGQKENGPHDELDPYYDLKDSEQAPVPVVRDPVAEQDPQRPQSEDSESDRDRPADVEMNLADSVHGRKGKRGGPLKRCKLLE